MGFLLLSESVGTDVRQQQEDAVLHRLGCKICPLAKLDNEHPDMAPTGSEQPLVYCLGEAPGEQEDRQGEQFVGRSGQLLRDFIPHQFKQKIRWNNCVRTRPRDNATPERVALECCRPSVVVDIERSKPKAIFGFGDVPLHWVSGFHRITDWRGRRMPVRVGQHACWYYAFYHPAFILHMEQRLRPGADMTEEERMFRLDLRRAFREVESLPEPIPHDPAKVGKDYLILPETGAAALRRLETLLGAAAKAPVVGVDYETHRLRPYHEGARILTAAVSTPETTFAFPFDHPEAQWSKQHRNDLTQLWRRFLLHCKGEKIVHMLAFELEWTAVEFGTDLVRAGQWHDTASEACILDERRGKSKPGPFALEFLVQQYFGFNLKQLSNVDRNRLIEEPLTAVLRYNGGDAEYHRLLHAVQQKQIKEQQLTEAYRLALRRIPTVVLSQVKGAPVDQDVVGKLRRKYEARIRDLEKKIQAEPVAKRFQMFARRPFNPRSPKEVIRLFHEMLKYEEMLIYDRGQKKERLSSDETVLAKIAEREPLAQLILDLRGAEKLKSTYIDPLAPPGRDNEESVLCPDGLIHTQFNTIFAETGRLSSEEPNLQNFPKREDEAKEVRRPIRAAPGHYILAFDYGQIEARVIAMFTKDKRFVDALWNDFDVHMDWAQRIASSYPRRIGGKKFLTDKGVMKKFRGDIKNQWTFPLFFGAQLKSVAGYLDIPEEELRDHYHDFWKEFSGVKAWQEDLLAFYREHGYVECLTGRRRRGPLSINQVYNSPVQGTAAEIVLDAMSRLSETGDPELQPEINIHDDLTFLRVPEGRFEDIVPKVVDHMLAVPFRWAKIVPISVELSVGYNWMKMEEIGVFKSNEWFKERVA